MTSSFRLGRIAGIEIGANWSWLLVVALIVLSLAGSVFPAQAPGLDRGTYVLMAVVAAALFFGSLLAHELGHALQARRDGMEIDGITLWVFGGVARFRGTLPSAGVEFRVAIAGPLVSLAFAAVFLAVSWLADLPDAVDAVVFYVGWVNALLLAFNMLPALPLDGGRVFRSALWARRGDFLAATRTAAAWGRGFGFLLVGAGLALLIFVGLFSGLWLAFIGWFLLSAAEAELQAATQRDVLEDLTVDDLMVRDPVTVPAGTTLLAFMEEVFFPHRHTAYPVVRGGLPVGLLTFRQVLQVPRAEWPVRRVEEVMLPLTAGTVVPRGAPLQRVLADLQQGEARRALVVDGPRLAGLLSLTDVARVLEARQAVAGALPPRPPGAAGPGWERPRPHAGARH
jgi:Zn-dependent protease/CBS domain-containing protein